MRVKVGFCNYPSQPLIVIVSSAIPKNCTWSQSLSTKATVSEDHNKDLFGYRLLLKIENWKYCSKIIFKCVNSAVWPTFFKKKFAEIRTYRSREQCTEPTQNVKRSWKFHSQCYPNSHLNSCSFGMSCAKFSKNCF